MQILEMFLEELDDLGFGTPPFSLHARRLEKKELQSYRGFTVGHTLGYHEANPIAPLAQHHGIPTRLLDWTESPLNALYFAAAPQYRESTGSDPMSFFALNVDALGHHFDSVGREGPDNGLDGHPVPRAIVSKPRKGTNPYLKAQRGLFTEVVSPHWFFVHHGRWPSLEEVIEINHRTSLDEDRTTLIKVTLPSKEVGRLFMLLDREGISEAALMPTHDKAAQTVLQRVAFLRIRSR